MQHKPHSELLLNNFDGPLVVLASYCQQVLDSDYLLKEVVREADIEWGRVMLERPHLEKEDYRLTRTTRTGLSRFASLYHN